MTCVECGGAIALPTGDPFRCARCRGDKDMPVHPRRANHATGQQLSDGARLDSRTSPGDDPASVERHPGMAEPVVSLRASASDSDERPHVVSTDQYYDPVPPSDSHLRHAYTLDLAQLRESRDQWKARAEELVAGLEAGSPFRQTLEYVARWLRCSSEPISVDMSHMLADRLDALLRGPAD